MHDCDFCDKIESCTMKKKDIMWLEEDDTYETA